MLRGSVGVAFADNLYDLVNSPTTITDEFSSGLDIADRFEPVWRQNVADVGHGALAQKKASDLKDVLTLNMAYGSQVANFIANSRSGTRMYVALTFTGPQIGTSGYNRSVEYICSGIVTCKEFKDSQGNIFAVDFEVNVKHDVSSGFRSSWTLVNDVAAYTS